MAAPVTDDDIMAQESKISEDIAKTQPLLGDLEPSSVLLEEYKENPAFLPKIEVLRKTYSKIRRIRKDGNCFYRAYMFALCQYATSMRDGGFDPHGEKVGEAECPLFSRALGVVDASAPELLKMGYEEYIVGDFQEEFMDILQLAWRSPQRDLAAMFNDAGTSNYLIFYARLLTSMSMRSSDTIKPFVEAVAPGVAIKDYAQRENEPMGKDADHLQIMSLANLFEVSVRVMYLDATDKKEPTVHDFLFEDKEPQIHLLYRPGHFDVLYV